MARVMAQPVNEEFNKEPSFSSPDCLLIGSPTLYPTPLSLRHHTTGRDWNYEKVGKDTE